MGTPVVDLLDQLAEYQAQRDVLRMDKEALIASIIPDEIKEKIAEIEEEFSEKVRTANENISGTETIIRNEVADYGKTIRGAHLMAVCSKGRTTWNTKALEGYSVAHPEILAFREVGEPSVGIRRV